MNTTLANPFKHASKEEADYYTRQFFSMLTKEERELYSGFELEKEGEK